MRHSLTTIAQVGVITTLFMAACGGRMGARDWGDATDPGGKSNQATVGGANATGGVNAASASGNATGGAPTLANACVLPVFSGCVYSQQNEAEQHANVLVLVDKSASMAGTPVGYTKSNWEGVIDAFAQALSPNDVRISYGLLLYPEASPLQPSTCTVGHNMDVPVASADTSVPTMRARLLEARTGGLTPTAAALKGAYDYFTTGTGMSLQGAKFVLLITDGGPNCNATLACGQETCTQHLDKTGICSLANGNCCDESFTSMNGADFNPRNWCLDDAAVTAQLDALRAAGIKTFIVGLPGSEPYADYLDRFAESGAVPVQGEEHKYYAVAADAELSDTLSTITELLAHRCQFPLPGAPLDLNNLGLLIDCSFVPTLTGGTYNWQYDIASQSIVIQGTHCEALKATKASRVDVAIGCARAPIL